MDEGVPDLRFVATRWSKIVKLRGDDANRREGLDWLAETYREPMVNLIRRLLRRATGGRARPDEAEDVAQSFFAKAFEKKWFEKAAKECRSFRSYVIVMARRHVLDHVKVARAAKRNAPDESAASESPLDPTAGAVLEVRDPIAVRFEREWLRVQIARALAEIRAQHADYHAILQNDAGDAPLDDPTLSTKLGISREALRQRRSRARRLFRACLEREVRDTVESEVSFREELAAVDRLLGDLA
ncbi:MAG: hypothetical protein HYR85_15535 [Planctomycetes bacterium]|nr:hypothetical protein [Planctomycetota bacterium]MBI3843276.1 hypothetical protein [Planctomycetota bacterium]